MERNSVNIGEAYSIEYFVYGQGSKDIFCFHGFGESGKDMKMIAHLLKDKDYRVIAPNFFFHGESAYPENRIDKNPISSKELGSLILDFMDLVSPNQKQHLVFGYSLGGKVVLSLLENYSPNIKQAILAAPDGLIAYWWYVWFSHWRFAQRVFKWFIINPWFYFKATNVMMCLYLLPKKAGTFSQNQMRDKENRIRIYNTWMSLKKVHPKANTIGKAVKEDAIKLDIIMGKYDRVIPLRNANRFLKKAKLNQDATLHILESGHNLHRHGRLEKTIAKLLA